MHMDAWWLAPHHGQLLLQFLLNEMDRDLPSCLWALRHVFRRGIDWFQKWCRSFCTRYSLAFGPFTACTCGWMKRLHYCDYFMNQMHWELHPCLRAASLPAGMSAWIQERSGLVPTASVLSFGVENVFWSISRCIMAANNETSSTIATPHEGDELQPSFLFAGTSAGILKRPWCLLNGGNGGMVLILCNDTALL